ncbi:MAG: cation-transporting P-type ATPase [Desulfobacteraceae bacterium]|nr:cation-transporting P-type ATPase [Desulfobacteraceae bacterium]
MVTLIHDKVPGRVRYKVKHLYNCKAFKRMLEQRLSKEPHIHKVSASTRTGNILVCYEPGTLEEPVGDLIKKTIKNALLEAPRAVFPPTRKTIETNGAVAGAPPDTLPWHSVELGALLALLETEKQSGLKMSIVHERFRACGPNLLERAKSRSRWDILTEQFTSFPVVLLGVAAGISVFTGGLIDAGVIMGVVAANALIGYKMESEAEATLEGLKRDEYATTEVIRDGVVHEVTMDAIVPGDILILKQGSYVPADCRILEAVQLSIDESLFTGESLVAAKTAAPAIPRDIPLADRKNMAYMGTTVVGGTGLGVAVATGNATEIGQLQLLLDENIAPESPIKRQLREIGNRLVFLFMSVCSALLFVGTLKRYAFLPSVRTVVSLAGSAVPEGLPTVVTISFALGVKNMKRHHVTVRRLESVETLGAAQAVCLDKTGTITCNTMKVMTAQTHSTSVNFKEERGGIDHIEFKTLLEICVLCNETSMEPDEISGFSLKGSPTENALVRVALNADMDVWQLRDDNPLIRINHRVENSLFMSSVHNSRDDQTLIAVKGSPMQVLDMCDLVLVENNAVSLTPEEREEIRRRNDAMAGDVLRVLGVAFKIVPNSEDERIRHGKNGIDRGLVWVGLMGMADPIRNGVQGLIHRLHRAGIETIMITGDQTRTARALADKLKLSPEGGLKIQDYMALKDAGPGDIEPAHVYSRVSYSQKLMIVKALQARGKVVVMTGDGINDGPALKAADVGIAMGYSGTEFARDAADIILETDDLETLIIAITDGRTIHDNIKKSVHYFISSNFSEIIVMSVSMAGGLGFPLNIMQLLWINLVTDIFPGIALSLEAPEIDSMEQPPRDAAAPLFSPKDYGRMAMESSIISSSALAGYVYGLFKYGLGKQANSMAFHTLMFSQLLHVLTSRSQRHTIFGKEKLPPNKWLGRSLTGSLILQLITMAVPGLRRFLGTVRLNPVDFLVVLGSALSSFALNETLKNKRLERKHDDLSNQTSDRPADKDHRSRPDP